MPSASLAPTVQSHVRQLWDPVPGYLDAASIGLPPRPVVEAMHEALDTWQAGRATAVAYDAAVGAARARYAELVGVPTGWVAVGSQTSVFAGNLAASLPGGAEVVTIEDDFSSVIFPFLAQAHRGITVRQVPRTGLAEAVTERTHLVAFSLAQSACGRLVDVPAVTQAAARHGALTFCDTTQATGWMPVDATLFDLTVCSAYKWLCQPRGTAYLTVLPEVAADLVPLNAGWYAGESVWESTYGPRMELAQDARRFDVSPAWLCWVGAAAAAEVFAGLPPEQVREHDAGLADDLLGRLGLEPCGRPVVSLPDEDGSRAAALARAGLVVSSRGGGVRIAFHLWNTPEDVALVHAALIR